MSLLLKLNPCLLEIVSVFLSGKDLAYLQATCRTLRKWIQSYCQSMVQTFYPESEVKITNYLFYRYSVQILYNTGGSYISGMIDWTFCFPWKDNIAKAFRNSHETEVVFILPIQPLTLIQNHGSDDHFDVREINVLRMYDYFIDEQDEEQEVDYYEITVYPGHEWVKEFIGKSMPSTHLHRWAYVAPEQDFPLLYAELRRRGYVCMRSGWIRDLNIIPENWRSLPCFRIVKDSRE